MFIEILFKMLLFKGGVLIYAEHCIYIYIYICMYVCMYVYVLSYCKIKRKIKITILIPASTFS